jgi:hypothetical protein
MPFTPKWPPTRRLRPPTNGKNFIIAALILMGWRGQMVIRPG